MTAAHPPPLASLSLLPLPPPCSLPPRLSFLTTSLPPLSHTSLLSPTSPRALSPLSRVSIRSLSPANTLAQRGRGRDLNRKRKERRVVSSPSLCRPPLSPTPHHCFSLWLIAPPSVSQNVGLRGRCGPEGGETGRGRVGEVRACGTLSPRANRPEF